MKFPSLSLSVHSIQLPLFRAQSRMNELWNACGCAGRTRAKSVRYAYDAQIMATHRSRQMGANIVTTSLIRHTMLLRLIVVSSSYTHECNEALPSTFSVVLHTHPISHRQISLIRVRKRRRVWPGTEEQHKRATYGPRGPEIAGIFIGRLEARLTPRCLLSEKSHSQATVNNRLVEMKTNNRLKQSERACHVC